MKLRALAVLLTAGLLVTLGQACTPGLSGRWPHARSTIPHPMQVNSLGSSQVTVENSGDEQPRGLQPGSLAQNAQISALDTSQACFDIVLRRLVDGPQSAVAVMPQMRYVLRANRQTVEGPSVESFGAQPMQMAGTRPIDVPTGGMETFCAQFDQYSNCINWQTRPLYRTEYIPETYYSVEESGRVCFPNTAIVDPTTSEIELYVISRPLGIAFYFEWELLQTQPAS